MKKAITLLGILVLFQVVLLAQDDFPSPRYGASVVEFEIDSATMDWVHYVLYGTSLYNTGDSEQGPQSHGEYYLWLIEQQEECLAKMNSSPVVKDSDADVFMYGQTAMNFNNQFIVIVGGIRSDSIGNASTMNKTILYDVKTNSIYTGELEPFPSKGFMAHCDMGKGTVFFNGGHLLVNGLPVSHPETFLLDMNTMTFTTKASCPKALSGHKAIADTANNKVYIFGGIDENGNNNFSSYEYNTQYNYWGFGPNIQNYPQNEWTGFSASGNTLNPNEIFILGGQKYSTEPQKYSLLKSENLISISSNLYTIKLVNGDLVATLVSSNIPPMIGGVAWYSLAANNDTLLYMFGGISAISTNGDTNLTNSFYRYNQTTQQIQQYDTLSQSWGEIISSIDESEFIVSSELEIYPNPASDYLNLRLRTEEEINAIKIYNQNGQLIKQIVSPKDASLNISDLNSGSYYVRIDTEDNKYFCNRFVTQ